MLSGIRTGKKKKASNGSSDIPGEGIEPSSSISNGRTSHHKLEEDGRETGGGAAERTDDVSRGTTRRDGDNLSAAERMKEALAAVNGGAPIRAGSAGEPTPSAAASSHLDRITSRLATVSDPVAGTDPGTFVVLDFPGTAAAAATAAGGRFSDRKREEDMSVAELAAKERAGQWGNEGGGGMSWDEHMSRDVIRVGKKRKLKAGSRNNEDSDDEVERMKRHLPGYHESDGTGGVGGSSSSSTRASVRKLEQAQQRDRRRTIDQFQKQEKITSLCSWWVQSSSFTKHRLLAFGRHVSLMLAPPGSSLVPGSQFYLVPLKHATSFVDCDDDGVWEEVAMFRTSLENVFARERKGIIVMETVLPNKGFWQTRMDVVPVPFSALQDAPVYFKSAMIEQAEDFGTHNKLLTTTAQKPVRNVVPKRFPYFYVGWGNISTSPSTGFAQIIESATFRHDFGLDTLAGMLDLDPVRFQRKARFPKDAEDRWIEEFVEKWRPFDWTEKLE